MRATECHIIRHACLEGTGKVGRWGFFNKVQKERGKNDETHDE